MLAAIRIGIFGAAGLLLVDACADDPCIPGLQRACECDDGEKGASRCNTEHSYGACECGASTGSISLPFEPLERPRKHVLVDSIPITNLFKPSSQIVDLFSHTKGIVVVSAKAIDLVDRVSGAQLGHVDANFSFLQPTLADDVLVVNDPPNLESFDVGQALAPLATIKLSDGLDEMVMLSGQRLVCSLKQLEQRTYAARTGELLATNKTRTILGSSWRRVPESDRFVTYSGQQYLLYELAADHNVSLLARSNPAQDNYEQFAFDGVPAQHLVTRAGKMIALEVRGCPWPVTGDDPLCLVQDGALGVGSYSTVDNSAERLFGLTYTANKQDDQYSLASIDIEARSVLSQRLVPGVISSLLRADPTSGRVVLVIAVRNPSGGRDLRVKLVAP